MIQSRFKLSLIAMVFGFSSFAAQSAELRIAVEGAYKPFSWKEADGTLKGFDI